MVKRKRDEGNYSSRRNKMRHGMAKQTLPMNQVDFVPLKNKEQMVQELDQVDRALLDILIQESDTNVSPDFEAEKVMISIFDEEEQTPPEEIQSIEIGKRNPFPQYSNAPQSARDKNSECISSTENEMYRSNAHTNNVHGCDCSQILSENCTMVAKKLYESSVKNESITEFEGNCSLNRKKPLTSLSMESPELNSESLLLNTKSSTPSVVQCLPNPHTIITSGTRCSNESTNKLSPSEQWNNDEKDRQVDDIPMMESSFIHTQNSLASILRDNKLNDESFQISSKTELEEAKNLSAIFEIDEVSNTERQKENYIPKVQIERRASRIMNHRSYRIKYHPIHAFLYKHQRQGVGFLHSNLSQGKGCLLCDHMGLGKTITCLAYISQFCRKQNNSPPFNTGDNNFPRNGFLSGPSESKTVLILMPTSVIGHWESELEKVNSWLLSKNISTIDFHIMSSSSTKISDRGEIIERWFREKSVLLVSYGLFRSIVLSKAPKSNHELLLNCQYIFLDEGHRIKNTDSQTYFALQEVKTRKRIVCTGYPMQNNLGEYWSLIDFARPGSLGSFDDYREKFILPIERGLVYNTTEDRKKNARYLAYMLHETIRPFVLRRDVSILKETLPPRHEIFITVHPTLTQRNLINALRKEINNRGIGRCYFWLFSIIGMCMNHPDILVNYMALRERKLSELRDILRKNQFDRVLSHSFVDCEDESIPQHIDEAEGDTNENEKDLRYLYLLEKEKVDILKTILKYHQTGDLYISNKMIVLFRLLFQCKIINEKIVVFSKSIATLNFIQDCILEHNNRDAFNRISFVRLDGSTPAHRRKNIVKEFNESPIDVALISTLAGGEGINLCSANRIIIMDVNFNPSHDAEACCRVYRYGQTREVYIYRLIGNSTLEQKVLQSQLKKERLSSWIVDDMNFDVFQVRNDFNEEIPSTYEETEVEIPIDFDITSDVLLQNIVEGYRRGIAAVQFHDTLLFDNDQLDLDESEIEDALKSMKPV